jgi:hypothetical protein
MKYFLKSIIFSILIMLITRAHCQKIKLEYGNMNFLKNEKGLRLEFDYDSMSVGEFSNEQNYINNKVRTYNEDTYGKGDAWLLAWKGDREQYFEPAFRKSLNLAIKPLSMSPNYDSTAYTLIVKTIFTEPGFYATRLIAKDAMINVTYLFVDSQDHNRIVARLSCMKITSFIENEFKRKYAVEQRLTDAYRNAGSLLGKYISIINRSNGK